MSILVPRTLHGGTIARQIHYRCALPKKQGKQEKIEVATCKAFSKNFLVESSEINYIYVFHSKKYTISKKVQVGGQTTKISKLEIWLFWGGF